jgi:hypothetical protein
MTGDFLGYTVFLLYRTYHEIRGVPVGFTGRKNVLSTFICHRSILPGTHSAMFRVCENENALPGDPTERIDIT